MAHYHAASTPDGEVSNIYRFPRPDSSIPQPPLPPCFLSVPNILNFRHTGTHRLPNGRRMRTDLVFRSAEPSPINDDGIAAVQRLGLTTVYDLRSPTEVEKYQAYTPVVDIPGTQRVFVPVYTSTAPDDHARRMEFFMREGTSGFADAYAEMLEIGSSAYGKIFEHLRDRPDAPLLYHCTAGKDRTGVATALILELAGVPDQDIADEYSLTELGLATWVPAVVDHILKDPAVSGDRPGVERIMTAKKENMLAFLERMRKDWGGAQGYLTKKVGFSEEDIEKIKQNVTEPDTA